TFTWEQGENGSFSFTVNAVNTVSYTWNFGDGSSPATMFGPNMFHTFNEFNIYTVTLTLKNDCADSVVITHTVGYTGINTVVKDDNILIYPNPASTVLTIENKGHRRIESYIVYDGLGRNITEAVLSGTKDRFNIDLSTWNRGVYTIALITGDGIVNKRFSVSR